MRIAFGSDGRSEREQELRTLIPEMMDRCESAFTLLPWFRRELGGVSPYARLMRFIDRIDRGPLRGDRGAPRRSAGRGPRGRPFAAGASHLRRREPLEDEAVRDELLTLLMAGYETTTSRARMGVRAAPASAREAVPPHQRARARRPHLPRGGGQGDLAPTAGGPRCRPEGAGADRAARLRAPAGSVLMVSDLPDPQRPGDLARTSGVPAGAIPRSRPRGGSVDPLRWGSAPLPRRGARSIRDRGCLAHHARRGRAVGARRLSRAGCPSAVHPLARTARPGNGRCGVSGGRRAPLGRAASVRLHRSRRRRPRSARPRLAPRGRFTIGRPACPCYDRITANSGSSGGVWSNICG